MAVKNKPAHVSSQIKIVLAHLGGGGIRSKVLNKQVSYTYYVPGCVLFVRDTELNEIIFQKDRCISI